MTRGIRTQLSAAALPILPTDGDAPETSRGPATCTAGDGIAGKQFTEVNFEYMTPRKELERRAKSGAGMWKPQDCLQLRCVCVGDSV